MKAAIIKIGNSKGLRIPKPIIEQCGFTGEVEIEVHDRQMVVKPVREVRAGWEKEFAEMAENGDDALLPAASTRWDEEEWEWK